MAFFKDCKSSFFKDCLLYMGAGQNYRSKMNVWLRIYIYIYIYLFIFCECSFVPSSTASLDPSGVQDNLSV